MGTPWIAYSLALALGCFGLERSANAEQLFRLSGHVALADAAVPDGTRVKLRLDLDRNGKLESFETLSGFVGEGGSYDLHYDLDPRDVDLRFMQFAAELIAAYQARGFDALLDDGPLPVVLSFEREGYSTVVKRLTTLHQSPSIDIVLARLPDVSCADTICLSPNGSVRLSGFAGGTGIERAYANAFDPSKETTRFPGFFSDKDQNLLVSSGFAEINLYDEGGEAIHAVTSPVSIRFEAKRPSWRTMPDLEGGSGRVELPMYSFDEPTGQWIREGDGQLEFADGSLVPEDSLDAIRAGNFKEKVFVAFDTKHFSTFNCDAPIEERACVKGRIVTITGEAVGGVQVTANGVSYTGTAGAVVTGADGAFASDVMKSEQSGEDVDGNGKTGEVFSARISASAELGVFVGNAFDTPTARGSIELSATRTCRPQDCTCLDLGDIIADFELPRLCEITVRAIASGVHVVGDEGPIKKDEAVTGATMHAGLCGATILPQSAVAAVCAESTCGSGVVDADGTVRLVVPVVGEAPEIQLDANLTIAAGDVLHYYSGSIVTKGCTRSQSSLDKTVSVKLDHAALSSLAVYIRSLGGDPIDNKDAGIAPWVDPAPMNPIGKGCGCRTGAATYRSHGMLAFMALAIAFLGLGLRRHPSARAARVRDDRDESEKPGGH